MSKEKLSEHINLNCCGQGMQRCAVVERVMTLENRSKYHQELNHEQQFAIKNLERNIDLQKSKNMLLEEEIISLRREINNYEDMFNEWGVQ